MNNVIDTGVENRAVLKLKLKPQVELKLTDDGKLAVQSPINVFYINNNVHLIAEILNEINASWSAKRDMESRAMTEGGLGCYSQISFYLARMEQMGLLIHGLFEGDKLMCEYEDMTGSPDFVDVQMIDAPIRLNQYVCIRRFEENFLMESPEGNARIYVYDNRLINFISLLNKSKTISEILAHTPDPDESAICNFISMLATAKYLDFTNTKKENESLWAFHDRLFHSRTRYGRHNLPSGGTFRFLDTIQPPKAKPSYADSLKSIDLNGYVNKDALSKSLLACLDQRSSQRNLGAPTINDLANLLYFSLGIKGIQSYPVGANSEGEVFMEIAKAPFASGGGIYELRYYLTVKECIGLEPGFYVYDAFTNVLHLLKNWDEKCRAMMWYASACIGAEDSPPVLLTMAADFERMFWKYENIAYATILKNTGSAYQTLYLNAAALDMGVCGLGNGNIELLGKLTGKETWSEGSVGELIIGSIKR